MGDQPLPGDKSPLGRADGGDSHLGGVPWVRGGGHPLLEEGAEGLPWS